MKLRKKTFIILVLIVLLGLGGAIYYQFYYKSYTCYDLAGQAYESDIDCTQWQS